MADEGQAPTETPTPPADGDLPSSGDASKAPGAADWRQILETVPPEELRKHPRIAGIAGEHAQRLAQAERERFQREDADRSAQQQREHLRKLAAEDPVTFAQKYLSDDERRQVAEQLDGVRQKTREEFATHIGRAFQDVPEWKQLTAADFDTLSRAVAGKADDDVIPAYNRAALDLIAEKRAATRFESYRTKELAKEREAIRQEEAGKLLKTESRPDLTKGRTTTVTDEPDFESDPIAWNRWYDKKFGNR